MPALLRTIVTSLAASGCAALIASTVDAAEGAPLGFWRATNDCFLAVFLLAEDGHAQTAYKTGEQEENGRWTWDGTTLKITSPMFPEDEFTGHLANDQVEVDYVWHDLDRDQLNRQSCVFERAEPMRL